MPPKTSKPITETTVRNIVKTELAKNTGHDEQVIYTSLCTNLLLNGKVAPPTIESAKTLYPDVFNSLTNENELS